jgi:excisionase family DNA binding protein
VTDPLDALFEGRKPTLEAGEVAELLGMTKQGVYNWLRDGVIPGYKLGSSWFILRDDLKEAMRHGSNRPLGGAEASHEGG